MTSIINAVKEAWPGVSDDTAEVLLWETTSFPFSSADAVVAQLTASYTKFGGDVQLAINDAYAEIDRAMQSFKLQEANHGNI